MNDDVAKAGSKHQILSMWVIWFAILSALFVMAVAGGQGGSQGGLGIPPKPESWPVLLVIGLVFAGMGIVCRVLVLPRVTGMQAKMSAMLVGLALCEACGIIGIFVIDRQLPAERIALFRTSAFAVLISAPIYARPSKASLFHQS